MAASMLLNQVSSEFGGDALNRIAAMIGESPGKIKTAVSDMLPALLGGLASKAQTPEGAHELLEVIHRDHLDTARYDHVADAIREPDALGNLMNAGGPLLDTVLPGKSGAVSNWVASHAGIHPASSRSLMSMVLPLVLGLIGRRAAGRGESGLTSLLGKPQSFLQDAPGGLAGVLGGLGSAGMPPPLREAAASPAVQRTAPASSWRNWLPLLMLLALVAALLGYFVDRGTETAPSIAPPAATTPVPAPAAPAAGAGESGAFVDRPLPDGAVLHIPANGVESRLLAFIADPSQPVSPTTWFTLDRVEFETSAATLKPSSLEQLGNIAVILRAYPQVTLKFGGYTDNTGNPEQNLDLSRERANRALSQVVALGIEPSRLAAEGYGDQHAAADNATSEGRQRNRRVDINVTAK